MVQRCWYIFDDNLTLQEERRKVQIQFIRTGYFLAEPPLLSPYIIPIPIPTSLPCLGREQTLTGVSLMTIARLPLLCWKIRLFETREVRRVTDKADIEILVQKVRAMAVFVTI